MLLYEIALPLADNSGETTQAARSQWEAIALRIAGGFTRRPDGFGYWKGPDKVYVDPMACYHVAVVSVHHWHALVAHAFDLFPDQLAIFHAKLGEAQITSRAEMDAYYTSGGSLPI